jgi:predicted RNase H-like nuclease
VGDVVTVRGWIPVFVENGLGPGGRGRTAHIKWFGRVVEFLHQIPEDELLRIKEVKPS